MAEHDERPVEAVARALEPWTPDRGRQLAQFVLAAIDAAVDEQGNRIAWVAPWEATGVGRGLLNIDLDAALEAAIDRALRELRA